MTNRLITAMALLALQWPILAAATDPDLAETPEIQFSSELAKPLRDKAAELGAATAIYEFVRNEAEVALYQGSRSGAVNTFLGMRGNDVDIASTLIAMLRSRGIPARYAVGTVQIEGYKVMNWLGVQDMELARSLLRNQGIQKVVMPGNGTFEFEHVWVEALVSVKNYRGAGPDTQGVNCATQRSECVWAGLAPAFKQLQYHNQNLYVGGAVPFDYARYYNAIKDSDDDYLGKNPLEIHQEAVLAYLRTNHPGKTLEDVMDPGVIISERLGVLPTSLPFKVLGSVRRYNSVALHDAATGGQAPSEVKKWSKQLLLTVRTQPAPGAGAIQLPLGPFNLAELSTKRLTLTFAECVINSDPNCGSLVARLDGVSVLGFSVELISGTLFTIDLALDGAPAPDASTNDRVISAQYSNLVIGGYYLIGTGGHSSNWSQVHRATAQLLEANQQYPIVNNASFKPYVDENGNGVIDTGEKELMDHPAATDALTGGLLYSAMNLYFSQFHDSIRKLDALNRHTSQIEGFVGVVSTTASVEYVDDTAFSVMPGGLLIDMKGVSFLGPWRTNEPATFGRDHFDLIGHIGSSLEHEIWQELTGYDAVSTVRGIQMALAGGAALLTPYHDSTGNTFQAAVAPLGFSTTAPAGFTLRERDIFSTRPATWSATSGEFDVLKAAVSASDSALRRSFQRYGTVVTAYNGKTIDAIMACYDQLETELIQAGTSSVNKTFCDGSIHIEPANALLSQLQAAYFAFIDQPGILGYGSFPLVSEYFDFFDENQGFVPSGQLYRVHPKPPGQHPTPVIQAIRDDLYLLPYAEYVIPSRTTRGPLFEFSVYVRRASTGTSYNLGFLIQNLSAAAGGGYVDGEETLELTDSTVFNNEMLTDENLNALVNNDLIKTPSTADPVSTVTGNMYHDETDAVLKGRGLNYSFTRTYNSGPTTTETGDGPLGPRWTHSYNARLVSNDYGQFPDLVAPGRPATYDNAKTSSITYVDERGGEVNYLVNDSGGTPSYAITAPRGVFDALVLNSPATGQYTLTFRNGVRYVFEGLDLKKPGNTARLIRIADFYGNELTFKYNWRGHLSSVSDNTATGGRTGLTLSYELVSGRLSSVTDLAGRSWEYTYEGGNLASMTNPLGDTVTYSYQPDTALLETITLPAQREGGKAATTFRYYRNNKTFDYTNALGQVEALDYDLYRKRTRITDPRGFVSEHYYDDDGAPSKLVEPDGAILIFENNADGLRTSKIGGLGYKTQYSYRTDRALNDLASNTYGKVTKELDPLGKAVLYDYDVLDQIKSITDKNGKLWQRSFYQTTNAATGAIFGKVYRVFSPLSTTVPLHEYTYYANGNVKQRIEYIDLANTAKKRITDYTWDASGKDLLEQRTTGSGQTLRVTYTYDALGRKMSQTLHRRKSATDATMFQLTTSYTYDDMDRIVTVTDPVGNMAENVYDANGRVSEERLQFRRANGTFDTRVLARHRYDRADRRVKTIDVEGFETTFEYDEASNLIASTDANAHTTRYEYDAMNRRTAVVAANGQRSEMVYDLAGRLIKTIDANGNATRMEYDANGRVTKTVTPLGSLTQYVYDANGNVTKVTDPNAASSLQPKNAFGATIYNEYDAMNRLIRSVDATNAEALYTYDLLGNVLTVRDAELHTTTLVYDDLGRLVQVKDPLVQTPVDKVTAFTYDEAGNRLTMTDRNGEVTRYTYDNLNRMTLTEYLADGTQESRMYNIYGNLESVSNAAVTYTYQYDVKNRLTRKTDSRLNKSLAWTYDPAGMIRTKTDYQGDVTTYQYDSSNRLVSETNPAYVQASYHYDPAGRLLDRILSNGARTEYRYDADSRLSNLTNISAKGTVIQSRSYLYDQLRNIVNMTDTGVGPTLYTYDPIYRLKTVDGPGTALDQVYQYDKVGNRKHLDTGGGYSIAGYNYDVNNRLTGAVFGSNGWAYEMTFEYDDNGSRTVRRIVSLHTQTQTYTYDQKRRMTQIINSSCDLMGFCSSTAPDTFQYDPFDYRIQKVDSAGTKKYLLEGEHLEATYDQGNQLMDKYMRGAVIDEMVYGYRKEGSTTVPTTFHHDHLQSVIGLTGHDGTVQQTSQYDPFGNYQGQTGTTSNDLEYTGRERDRGSQLYYYRARYYDPLVGRFLTEDPKNFRAGINFYAYVGNNPLNGSDPMGLDVTSAQLELFGQELGIFIDWDRDGIFNPGEFTGVEDMDLGLYFESSDFDMSTVSAHLKGKLEFSYADDRASFDAGGLEFSQGFVVGDVSTIGDVFDDPSVVSVGLGFALPFPSESDVTVHSYSIGDFVTDTLEFVEDTQTFITETLTDWFLPEFDEVSSSVEFEFITPNLDLTCTMASGAGGGYVLYPGRANTNMMSSVYAKPH